MSRSIQATPRICTSRSPVRFAVRSRRAKRSPESICRLRGTAAVLGVNTNTLLRSLRLLRDEGLLEFRRGRGISVAGTPERGAVVERAKELVTFARRQGYQLDELRDRPADRLTGLQETFWRSALDSASGHRNRHSGPDAAGHLDRRPEHAASWARPTSAPAARRHQERAARGSCPRPMELARRDPRHLR